MGSQGAGEGERHPQDASVWRHLTDVCDWGEGTRYTLVPFNDVPIGAGHPFDFPGFCDVFCRSMTYLRQWRGSGRQMCDPHKEFVSLGKRPVALLSSVYLTPLLELAPRYLH